MPLKEIQKQVEDWISQYKLGYFPPLEILARLTEETGEVAREINHMYGSKKKKSTEDTQGLADELGDVIFTVACMANSHNIDLDNAFQKTMLKYNTRDKDRWEKKNSFWKPEHLSALEQVVDYSSMLDVAFQVLKEMPQPIGQVCGPISSGGYGTIEKNLEYFKKVIKQLTDEGDIIFDQMPLEKIMQQLKQNSGLSKEESNQKLLDEFYKPLFESGFIQKMYFIPDWESSYGANWERNKAKELGIGIIDLPKNYAKGESK